MGDHSTDVNEFMTDLDGGVFDQKLGKVLSDVAGAVIDHERKGSITIQLDISQSGASQVQVMRTLKFTRPTSRGEVTEKDVTGAPMHVGTAGQLTFFPESQGKLLNSSGQVPSNEETD